MDADQIFNELKSSVPLRLERGTEANVVMPDGVNTAPQTTGQQHTVWVRVESWPEPKAALYQPTPWFAALLYDNLPVFVALNSQGTLEITEIDWRRLRRTLSDGLPLSPNPIWSMADHKHSESGDGGSAITGALISNSSVDESTITDSVIDSTSVGATTPAPVSATTLSVSGGASLNGGVVINEPGANVNTRIEGDTDANALVVAGSTDAVLIGSATTPNNAKFAVISATKGSIALPVMTTAQRNAISSPATGMGIYNSSVQQPQWWNGSAWVAAVSGGTIAVDDGVTDVDPVTRITFASGATVTDAGGGVAEVDVTGGGITLPLPVDDGGTGADLGSTGPGHVIQASSGAPLSILKHNFTATTEPVSTDNSAAGYETGSRWLNTMNFEMYVKAGEITGDAIWTLDNFSAPLPAHMGGTGRNSPTSGALFVGAGTSPVNFLSPGANRNFAVSNGSAWQSRAMELADLPAVPTARAGITSSAITVTSSTTPAAISWQGEYYDTDGMWTNVTPQRFTIQTNGKYHFNVCLVWAAGINQLYVELLWSNAASSDQRVIRAAKNTSAAGMTWEIGCGGDFDCVAGDYVVVRMWQNSGGNRNINIANASTFEAFRIGA